MNYIDRIYGEFEVTEPVLLELINSPSLQRLKGVDQYGFYDPHFPGRVCSRFEHSMGVFGLLRRYGAGLEEQIAGLIHDVSHGAFSHCVDYAMEGDWGKSQGHQDSVFDEFVKRSELPLILEKYGIDPAYILDDANFPLKETKLPDLCADRIDYILRDAAVSDEISKGEVEYYLGHLKAKNGVWFFDNYESARQFADFFRVMNVKYYCGMPAGVMLSSVGLYLAQALRRGYVEWDDLYRTDQFVLDRIAKFLHEDAELQKLHDRMNLKYAYVNDPEHYDVHVFCKSRVIDPLFAGGVLAGGGLSGGVLSGGPGGLEEAESGNRFRRISEVDTSWKAVVAEEIKPKEYFVRFLEV